MDPFLYIFISKISPEGTLSKMSGTINDAITGAVVGNVLGTDRWMLNRNKSPETLSNDIQEYLDKSMILMAMSRIIRSVKQYDGFWIDDISSKIKSIDGLYSEPCYVTSDDGSILCWIYLSAFCDIFTNHDTFENTVEQICRITHDNDNTVKLCTEYCYLIHDIFCNHLDQEGILQLLPELDILAGDVPIYRDVRSTFFAGLWAFVHSTSYESAIDNCSELNHSDGFTNWIPTVAGILAGLYFGSESMPQNFIKKFKIDTYLNDLVF